MLLPSEEKKASLIKKKIIVSLDRVFLFSQLKYKLDSRTNIAQI